MKPDISEFSYGFALTSELVQSFGLQRVGAPTFPSLHAEGAPGGGFDVQLPGVPVFLQFKLSDCLTTRNALDHGAFGLPYYRFKIRPLKHSQQHNLLLALETQLNIVYYVSPRFHQSHQLNTAFVTSTVVRSSAFIAPGTIGRLPDQEEHSVSFGASSRRARFRSEPRDLKLADPENMFQNAIPPDLKAHATPGTRSFRELGDELVKLYAARSPTADADRAWEMQARAVDRDAGDYARYAALALFDAELRLVPYEIQPSTAA